jgi:hypothetical protein
MLRLYIITIKQSDHDYNRRGHRLGGSTRFGTSIGGDPQQSIVLLEYVHRALVIDFSWRRSVHAT